MADPVLTLDQAMVALKTENQALADQLRQARCDLHRLGVAEDRKSVV